MATKQSETRVERTSTKRKRGSQKLAKRPTQSSPITIGGGGSVKLKFDEDHYRPGAIGGFINARDELTTVLITNEDNDLIHNLYRLVEGKNCTVIIFCEYRNVDSIIKIQSRPGGPLVIDFDQGEFPYDRGRDHRYNGNRKIKKPVIVLDNDSGVVTTHAVPTNGKCGIFAINRL